MRLCNVYLFHFLVIVAANIFCVSSAHADVTVSDCVWLPDSNQTTWGGCPGNYIGLSVSNAKDVVAAGINTLNNWSNAQFGVVSWDSNINRYIASGTANYYSNNYFPAIRLTVIGSCTLPQVLQPDGSCAAPSCSAPGDYAGEALTQAGYGSRPICAPDLCYYNVGDSITSGEAAEPPNIQTRSWLGDATGATCTVVDGAGVGGCPAGQADLGFGCMTFADNQAAFDAVNHLGAYVDPCIAAGTCTSLIDPCIGAGTCVGTGTGVGGTAGSGGTGVGGSTYVDPCIAAGTCTAAADPCIVAGTCTGSGTGTGGTAGGVNPCIAAGTCAGSGTGTGSGTGSATESTLRSVLDTLGGLGDFGSVGNVDLGTKTVNVAIAPVSVGSNGSCPEPSPMVLHGQTYYFEWTTYCNFASGIKPIMLVFAWLSAAGILIGGFKSA